MKILFLTNLPSPYKVDFFNQLGKLCDLTVIFERNTATNRDVNWRNNQQDLYFHQIYLNSVNVGEESSFSLGQIKHIKKNKYDAIIISGYSSPTAMLTILYLHLHKIPFIMSCDGGMISSENKLKYFIKKFFISKASLWLSTGSITTEYLKHYGAMGSKIRVYPFTSIKEDDITKDTCNKSYYKTRLGISEEKMVLSVGQFIYRKGFDILLKACSQLDKSIGIYIVGGDPTEEYISLKQNLGLENVHFVGFKPKDVLKEYYLAADVFVLPTREDIWGLVINEAMAYGLPVITTNKCIAGTELIENGRNGYIVPVENSISIADKIVEVLNDDTLLNYMKLQSLEIISKYTIENMVRVNYLEIKKFVQSLK